MRKKMYIPSFYKLFFFIFYGEPQKTVPEYSLLSTGYIQCFVRAECENDAVEHAISDIRRNKWNVNGFYMMPVEIPDEVFPYGVDYDNVKEMVKKFGSGYVYIGISRDGKSYEQPFEFERNENIDYGTFYNAKRRIQNRKICLHFNAGKECNGIIKSHSIQNHNQLNVIARNSHVYTKNVNQQSEIGKYVLIGIKEMSTFYGFCGKHDNEVFHPIDDYPFSNKSEQAMLYAYRSICKELYTKQNALQLILQGIDSFSNEEVKNDFSFNAIGQELGIRSLSKLKSYYDDSLRNKRYSDAHYLLFKFKGNMNTVFSSLFEMDYDFSGNLLQNISDLSKDLQIITYSSVWISDEEWGFLFSWHNKNDEICLKFVNSLFHISNEKVSYLDCLFRLVIICENSAFFPDWWESLTPQQRTEITDFSSNIYSLYSDVSPYYLKYGCVGFCNWKCTSIMTNVDELKKYINEKS